MSEIALDSFVIYKDSKNQNRFDFFPQPKLVTRENDRTRIVLGDIPFPEGVPHPENALTLLYGFRDSLDELKKQYAYASANDMDLVKVSMKLDVGDIIPGTTSEENVDQTRFLRLKALTHDLQQIIVDGVNELLAKSDDKNVKFFERMTEAGQRPDLICQAIRNERIFRHVNSVVYQIPDGTPRGRQVATIFSTNVSEIAFRGEGAFDIELPRIQ